MIQVRTRFAPSPTGELHLGSLRTALYALLQARRHQGTFFIRIEDTDRERYAPGSEERILQNLKSLGILWDEGPDLGGPYGPYRQSERLEQYKKAAEELVEQGSAYRCDCSLERLQKLRDAQTQAKQPTRYDGHCRDRADVDPRKPYVIRFKIKERGNVIVSDVIHGVLHFNSATLDDFVLLKSDGYPTYHLAHVVDDAAMKTSHVIRGDEWLPSLPKHILLFQALGWEPPLFIHLPLLLNAQHKKLSKREGDVGVESFLSWCLPEALRNFTALLGWNPSDNRELYTPEELIAAFDISKVNRSPAIVDFKKLEWMNGEYIRQLAPEELLERVQRATGYFKQIDDTRQCELPNDPPRRVNTIFVQKAIKLEQPRLKRLNAFPQWYFFPFQLAAPLAWKGSDASLTKNRLEKLLIKLDAIDPWPDTPQELEDILKPWIREQGLGVGETLWPMRVALSGQEASPSPFELAWLFGKEETIKRIKNAIDLL